MKIEITDNRQEWLIKLGEQYAAAVKAEIEAELAYRKAMDEANRLRSRIVEVGTYILEARAEQEARQDEHKQDEPKRKGN